MEMPAISRRRALAYALVLLSVLALAGSYALRRDAPAQRPLPAAALAAEPAPARKLVVHVVGAVREPGLYRLREGSRVEDAIQRAVVPVRGSAGPTATGSAGAPGTTGGMVHLNSATLEDLDTLPGVGPVTAQKILDYRTANGAFSSVDELDAVPGIGPATLEELRPLVGL